jgi:tetratricopeptide (TPR) repeat protein
VSDLLAGLLGAVLATNSPQAVSNLVAEKTGFSIPVINTNDPVEREYYQILLDDDAAEKEVLGWMDNADAFEKAGGGKASPTLNLKIQQRLDVVKKEYQDFIQLHPKHVNARLAFGSFLNDNNDDDGAFTQWDTACQLAPDNPAAWDDLGNWYAFGHHGQVKKGLECYDKAIQLNPNQSVYYHNLAVTVYMYRKDASEYYHLEEQQVFDKALALYRQAIKLDPDNFVLFTDYAECFYGTNPPRWKDGLAAWMEALKIAHDDGEREGVYIHLARIHLKLGDYDQARANLDLVTNVNYADFKKRLTRNLNAALDKAKTNAPASPDSGGIPSVCGGRIERQGFRLFAENQRGFWRQGQGGAAFGRAGSPGIEGRTGCVHRRGDSARRQITRTPSDLYRLVGVNQEHPNLVAQQDIDTAQAKDSVAPGRRGFRQSGRGEISNAFWLHPNHRAL